MSASSADSVSKDEVCDALEGKLGGADKKSIHKYKAKFSSVRRRLSSPAMYVTRSLGTATATFEVEVSLASIGYSDAASFQRALEDDLEGAVSDGSLSTDLQASCGCDDVSALAVSVVAIREYPTLEPTPLPSAAPSYLPSPAPSLSPLRKPSLAPIVSSTAPTLPPTPTPSELPISNAKPDGSSFVDGVESASTNPLVVGGICVLCVTIAILICRKVHKKSKALKNAADVTTEAAFGAENPYLSYLAALQGEADRSYDNTSSIEIASSNVEFEDEEAALSPKGKSSDSSAGSELETLPKNCADEIELVMLSNDSRLKMRQRETSSLEKAAEQDVAKAAELAAKLEEAEQVAQTKTFIKACDISGGAAPVPATSDGASSGLVSSDEVLLSSQPRSQLLKTHLRWSKGAENMVRNLNVEKRTASSDCQEDEPVDAAETTSVIHNSVIADHPDPARDSAFINAYDISGGGAAPVPTISNEISSVLMPSDEVLPSFQAQLQLLETPQQDPRLANHGKRVLL